MYKHLILLVLCALIYPIVKAQTNQKFKSIDFHIDAGIDKSIIRDKQTFKFGAINPSWQVSYYAKKKYVNLAARFRGSMMYSLNSDMLLGIQSGLTIHFGEVYGLQNYTTVSVPIQFRLCYNLIPFNTSKLFFDAAGGINILKVNLFPHTEKSGPLYSAGFLFKFKSKLLLRGGYEHQIDNGTYRIFANPSTGEKDEIVSYKQKREQVYCGVGIVF